MDIFGNRAALLMEYPEIMEKGGRKKKQQDQGQTSLFGDSEPISHSTSSHADVPDFSEAEKLAFEKEFLGFYLTSHPQISNLIAVKDMITHDLSLLEEETEGTRVKVGGLVETVRKIFTKKNNSEMAFISISDEKGINVECVVFPKIYEAVKPILTRDTVILIEGKIDMKNDKPIIIAEKIIKV